MSSSSSSALSRSLTSILRHRAHELGLPVDADGFIPLASLLAQRDVARYSPTLSDIERIVAECPKQRFALRLKPESEGKSAADLTVSDFDMKANQGHSFEIAETAFAPVTIELLGSLVSSHSLSHSQPSEAKSSTEEFVDQLPAGSLLHSSAPTAIHGTFFPAWPLIVSSGGLSPCARQFVHFAIRPFMSTEMRSGMRRDCDLLLYVDLTAALQAGLQFFLSPNEVLLSKGLETESGQWFVPLRFINKVQILEKGKVVQELNGTEEILAWQVPEEKLQSRQKKAPSNNKQKNHGAKNDNSNIKQKQKQKQNPKQERESKADSDHASDSNSLSSASAPTSAPSSSPLTHLIVLDFEATCDNDHVLKPQEIIEFPMLLIEFPSCNLVDTFHTYVKPVYHPQLTPFCTELTGIQQETVDPAPVFPVVMKQIEQWFEKHQFLVNGLANPEKSFVFVTCGDWDLRSMLPTQLAASKARINSAADDRKESLDSELPRSLLDSRSAFSRMFQRWCNIKTVFCEYMHRREQTQKQNSQSEDAKAEDYSGRDPAGRYRFGMTGMLTELKLSLDGRHHSGIDDSKNIAKIVKALVDNGLAQEFKANGSTQWKDKTKSNANSDGKANHKQK